MRVNLNGKKQWKFYLDQNIGREENGVFEKLKLFPSHPGSSVRVSSIPSSTKSLEANYIFALF